MVSREAQKSTRHAKNRGRTTTGNPWRFQAETGGLFRHLAHSVPSEAQRADRRVRSVCSRRHLMTTRCLPRGTREPANRLRRSRATRGHEMRMTHVPGCSKPTPPVVPNGPAAAPEAACFGEAGLPPVAQVSGVPALLVGVPSVPVVWVLGSRHHGSSPSSPIRNANTRFALQGAAGRWNPWTTSVTQATSASSGI